MSTSTLLLQITKHAKLEKKEVDDVLGGEEAWKNVQKTDGRLHSCCTPWCLDKDGAVCMPS